jgi:hypothetical protein
MAALKQSMEAKGRAKVRDAVRKRMGKPDRDLHGLDPPPVARRTRFTNGKRPGVRLKPEESTSQN